MNAPLGYVIAWKGIDLHVSPGRLYTLDEAKIILAAKKIEEPQYHHLILEVRGYAWGVQ